MSNIIVQINNGDLDNCGFMQLLRLLTYLQIQLGKNVKVKFVTSLSLKYPEHEVEKIIITDQDQENIDLEVTTSFLGIIGTTGVLPSHYTESILEEKKAKDLSLLNFINIFYNRIIKSFANIIKAHNIELTYEDYLINDKQQSYNWNLINNLMGITPNIAQKFIPDLLLNNAGMLINASRSEWGLKTILSHYLQYPVEIEQFIAEKILLNPQELSTLGQDNNKLGCSFYLGQYAYFNQNKILVKICNLDLKIYNQFIYDQGLKKTLMQILDFYLDKHIDYKIVFLILEHEKFTQLGGINPRKIGINTWCKG